MSDEILYTDESPLNEGWYFARRKGLHHGRPVWVYEDGGVLLVNDQGDVMPLGEYEADIQWSPEPLVEPGGPVDETFGFREEEPA